MASLFQIRQTAAELLAAAFLQLFPYALLLEGRANEFGFYYDFCLNQPIDESFLPLLEQKILSILKGTEPFRFLEMMRSNARTFFLHLKQPHIAELLSSIPDQTVSLFQVGNFYDLFPFSYQVSKEEVGSVKLFEIESLPSRKVEAGKWEIPVYRVHGFAGKDPAEVKRQLKVFKQGKRQDHRLLGKELDLFQYQPELSPFEWLWRPNGAQLYHLLLELWQKTAREQGFFLTHAPLFLGASNVRDRAIPNGMEVRIDQRPCLLPVSPMYFHKILKSYPDVELPARYAECTRGAAQIDGELWGVFNSRIVSMDYAHIFCTAAQLENELISSLQFILKIIKMFCFEYQWIICHSSDAKSSGSVIQKCIEGALKQCNQPWQEEKGQKEKEQEKEAQESSQEKERLPGTADRRQVAPALQMKLIDSAGREWLGPRIELSRTGRAMEKKIDGNKDPWMISLSIYGSIERFAALLVEHYRGEFPFWLAPEQGRVLPVEQAQLPYAEWVTSELRREGFRFTVDRTTQGLKPEMLKHRVQKAMQRRVPYLIVLGEIEEKERSLTVRIRERIQKKIAWDEFLKQLQENLVTGSFNAT